MSDEMKFDPMTGQPINSNPNGGVQFDPMTGQPIQPSSNQGVSFDPMTGQPVQPSYNQMNGQMPYGNGPTSFDPMTGQPSFGGPMGNGPKKSKAPLIIGIIIALVVLVGGCIGALFLFGSEKDDPDSRDERSNIESSKEKDHSNELSSANAATSASTEDATSNASTEATTEDISVVAETASTDAPAANTTPSTVDTSDTFAFSIDGTAYLLPMKVSDLMAQGWVLDTDTDLDETLATEDSTCLSIYADDTYEVRLSITVKNYSLNAQQAKDCYITEASLSSTSFENNKVTFLNGQITLGQSTKEDVGALLTEEDSSKDDASIFSYREDSEDYSSRKSIYFSFEEDGSKELSYVDITCDVEPDDVEEVEISDAVPDYLSNYKAPSSLGNDLLSGNFEADGKVYALPVPLQNLLDDGWSYGTDEKVTVGAGQGYSLTLEKGNSTLFVSAFNLETTAVYLENTIVTTVSAYDEGAFSLSSNVKVGMSKADFDKLLKKQSITNYSYDKKEKCYTISLDGTDATDYPDSSIKITLDDDDDTISTIRMENYGWLDD